MNAGTRASLALILWLLVGPGLRADVTVYGDEPPVVTLILGAIIEDSDPLGSWNPFGPSTPSNLQGSGGRPSVAWSDGTAWPMAVWSDDGAPIGLKIKFSEWNGSGWGSAETLTSGFDENLDPQLFIEPDGTVHVVWWVPEPASAVFLRTRPAGFTDWNGPLQVSRATEFARRPSVAVHAGAVWISYERDSYQPGMSQDLVVARKLANGSFQREILASTTRAEALDGLLHETAGRFWADWKNTGSEFRCRQFVNFAWSSTASEPWSDSSWVGVEQIRRLFERQTADP